MAQEKNWVFRQLGGNKNKITLSGWNAPYGRHRQQAVARTPIILRHHSVRYPGNNGPPTRHIFGINYPDINLNGRFRSKETLPISGTGNLSGTQSAVEKVEAVKKFVKEAQLCDISWGSIVHITGFISEFDPGYESEDEVEWKMKILVDSDNMDLSLSSNISPKDITTTAQKLNSVLSEGLLALPTKMEDVGIKTSILDALDDYVSLVTGAVGQLNNVINQIGNFESGLANEAKRLIAGVHQLRTAIINTVEFIETANQDVLYIRDSAKDTISGNTTIITSATDAAVILALLADIENQGSASIQGNARDSIRAEENDTWEKISIRVFGGPSQADSIRKANGVKYGSRPRPGQLVTIPAT